MEIQTIQATQAYQSNTKPETSQKVENLFDNMVNEDGTLNLSTNESELKKLSYEEAKELRLKLEEGGYLKASNNGDQAIFMGSSLLTVTGLTNDDSFNKALFESMKTKENPGLYFDEVKHNMEYTQGRRAHPYPSISVEEAQGNYSPLTPNEMKNMDMKQFLQDIIATYEELLLSLPSYLDRDETEQTLNDYKELQKDYLQNKDNQNAMLESYTKNTKPNPLFIQE